MNFLKTERQWLLMRLEEIDTSIQIEEANLIQLPKAMDKKKVEMTSRYHELVAIRVQKNNVVPRSAAEDNRLIAEADAIRLDALNAVRAALDM